MGTSDLIRLAQELAECGGVHRLTSLINAAVHVTLEHERRRTVEAWEDGPCGVGMSDKVALASTPDGPAIIDRYKADRDAASRALGHDGAPERVFDPQGARGAKSIDLQITQASMCNAAPQMTLNGERKPLPQSGCQGEYPRGGRMQVCPVSDADCLSHCTRTSEADCPLTKRDFGLPCGGISHDADSKIAARFGSAQSDFARRFVPRHMPPVDPTIAAEDPA